MKFIPKYKNKTLLDKILHRQPKFIGYDVISEDNCYLKIYENNDKGYAETNSLSVGIEGLSNVKILEIKNIKIISVN